MTSGSLALSHRVNAEMNKKVLEAITTAYNEGDIATIEHYGLQPETAAIIRDLNLDAFSQIAFHHSPVVSITVDEIKLKQLIANILRFAEQRSWVDTLIKLKAPINMLESLAGETRQRVLLRRQLFGVECPVGRIVVLPEAEQQLIEDSWNHHLDKNVLERCVCVYEDTGIFLNQAWPVIRQLTERV